MLNIRVTNGEQYTLYILICYASTYSIVAVYQSCFRNYFFLSVFCFLFSSSGIDDPSCRLVLVELKTSYDVYCRATWFAWANQFRDSLTFSDAGILPFYLGPDLVDGFRARLSFFARFRWSQHSRRELYAAVYAGSRICEGAPTSGHLLRYA